MAVKLYQREDFDHFETVQTRWKDMDALRHINHAAYLSFMETARLNYWINKESLTIPCHIDKG